MSAWKILYKEGKIFQKLFHIANRYLITVLHFYSISKATYIFIHREITPIGFPFFEWIFSRILKKKIIYDFDDAIWMTDKTDESSIERWIRNRDKVAKICTWSYKVSCGNAYLQQYALQFNPASIINPTTIDTRQLHNPELYKVQKDKKEITIGWTGSHSTLKYLKIAEAALIQIESEFPHVHFILIADQSTDLKLSRIKFIKWNKETEAEDLLKIDIGIMPLPDDEWSKGKCGFKALQYMAMEIPCVVSPVGVNTKIVSHGKNGFLAASSEEWCNYLKTLIENEALRKTLGKAGRKTVIENYSIESNSDNFLELFT
jgi:glycosyltransferase involved in cell wall biosynthesis